MPPPKRKRAPEAPASRRKPPGVAIPEPDTVARARELALGTRLQVHHQARPGNRRWWWGTVTDVYRPSEGSCDSTYTAPNSLYLTVVYEPTSDWHPEQGDDDAQGDHRWDTLFRSQRARGHQLTAAAQQLLAAQQLRRGTPRMSTGGGATATAKRMYTSAAGAIPRRAAAANDESDSEASGPAQPPPRAHAPAKPRARKQPAPSRAPADIKPSLAALASPAAPAPPAPPPPPPLAAPVRDAFAALDACAPLEAAFAAVDMLVPGWVGEDDAMDFKVCLLGMGSRLEDRHATWAQLRRHVVNDEGGRVAAWVRKCGMNIL
jgi:hypothetical protein